MKKKKKLFESIGKTVYSTAESELQILEFNDEVLVNKKKSTVKSKGIINCQIATLLFDYLAGFNVPIHYFKLLSDNEMLVRSIEMIPIEIRMHNLAANDLCDRFGIEQWKLLACPIIEFYFKNNSSNHHLINNFHIVAFKMATPDDIKIIERLTSKINAVLKSFFLRRQLQLVNFKLEFGRFNNKIMLGSALDFDTCKLIRASVSPTKDDFSDVGKKYEQLYQIILDK